MRKLAAFVSLDITARAMVHFFPRDFFAILEHIVQLGLLRLSYVLLERTIMLRVCQVLVRVILVLEVHIVHFLAQGHHGFVPLIIIVLKVHPLTHSFLVQLANTAIMKVFMSLRNVIVALLVIIV